jgi:glutaredoxin 3
MTQVVMYSTSWCPYCAMAKRLLEEKGQTYEEIDVEAVPGSRQEMMEKSGRHTVPQIFVGTHHVGGFDDLMALESQGKLDGLLAGGEA